MGKYCIQRLSNQENSMRTITIATAVVLILTAFTRAELKTELVDYKDGDTTLQGYLAYDDKIDGKKPGILIVHEWWGLNDYPKSRAEQLAKMGYVAFALDMYGKGVSAGTPQEAGKLAGAVKGNPELLKRRANLGLAQLKANTRVDGSKIAMIGYCFGGSVSLEMARSGADLAGVVSFHGDLSTQSPAKQGMVKARILACHGADDPFVKPEAVMAFWQEMKAANANFQINIYSGAVHAFTNPNADKHNIEGIKYNEQADRRSWEAMKAFFDEIFGQAAK
jgi:dienelactone hydrolase